MIKRENHPPAEEVRDRGQLICLRYEKMAKRYLGMAWGSAVRVISSIELMAHETLSSRSIKQRRRITRETPDARIVHQECVVKGFYAF